MRVSVLVLMFCIFAAGFSDALADCVSNLANCATECDQTTKPEDPGRGQCAQRCISGYPRCIRLEAVGQRPGGTVLSPKKQIPAQ
jgi:hypothetical protein